MASSTRSDLARTLLENGVETRYHKMLADMTADGADLRDLTEADLRSCEDAEGAAVAPAVARGLVRKLRGAPATPLPLDGAPSGCGDDAPAPAEAVPAPTGTPGCSGDGKPTEAAAEAPDSEFGGCHVSLLRAAAPAAHGGPDASLVRMCLRGRLPPREGGGRRKVLAVVLDRSGSMAGAMWRRVVEAVVGVVTDEMLQSPRVSIAFVVYADEAREVPLSARASELRDLLLSSEYAPRGGTCFRAAFQLAQQAVERNLAHHAEQGGGGDVDVATMIFTDGEDTSVKGRAGRYGVPLVDKEASSQAARDAGDAFREALRQTGCPTYTCIAAFGVDHDPDQCQYLSDRYYYINRSEALAEVLAGGLGALLASAGQCSVRLTLPSGAAMEERLLPTLPLDAEGSLDHHVWLRAESSCGGACMVEVEIAGKVVLRGTASMGAAAAASAGSFEDHLFRVDLMALRLRRVARELGGGRVPSAEQLGALRARLTDVKDGLQATKDLAGSAKCLLRGRAALRERLAEVEASRERLSYALGQFDESDVNDQRTIGSVAIDAILRDAGQHVPQGPAAAALSRRADEAAALPAPEALSRLGQDYTTDLYSCCDAQELAAQGDALFFQASGVKPAPGGGFLSAEVAEGLVSYEAFVLLSGGGQQAIKGADGGPGFTHCGVPLYATPGHFLRARLLLPDVLAGLSPAGVYEPGRSERQLLGLLGRAVARGLPLSEGQATAALHQARAVHAALAATDSSEGEGSLLAAAVEEASRFIDDVGVRAAEPDLYAIFAGGLLAKGWSTGRRASLGKALVEECLRRRLAHALRSAGEAQRLCFAHALLGPGDADDAWMDATLPCPGAGDLALGGDGFSPFAAPDELVALEREFPAEARPRAAGAAALLAALSSKPSDATPEPRVWSALRLQLAAWGRLVEEAGGLPGLWARLDSAMVERDPAHAEALRRSVGLLRAESPEPTVRGVFPDLGPVLAVAASICLPEAGAGQGMRLAAASALRALVERRAALVRKFPITGADFPRLDEHSRETVGEVWGAAAYPTDPDLHHKALLRVWRRNMRAPPSRTVKEALTDKEYRRRGGRFAFPSPLDTFVRGLHRRTADLHQDWQRSGQATSGGAARAKAVAEMLLRLRWDDRDGGAREKLSVLVARIWDGLEGLDLAGRPPLSSAIWLRDAHDAEELARLTEDAEAPEALVKLVEEDAAGDAEDAEAADGAGSGAAEAPAQAALDSPGVAPACCERRAARDGQDYTQSEFLEHYGVSRGQAMWDEALPGGQPAGAATGSAAASAQDEAAERQARAARARRAMDPGLQAALDGLEQELRRRMDAFAGDARPGSRVKLPLSLSAKQRKAVHLWADMQGLEHRSFGYRDRRRLHLSVQGAALAGAAEGEEFDYAAWASGDDSDDEEDEP